MRSPPFWLTEKAEAPPTARVARASDSFMVVCSRLDDGMSEDVTTNDCFFRTEDDAAWSSRQLIEVRFEGLSAAMTSLAFFGIFLAQNQKRVFFKGLA